MKPLPKLSNGATYGVDSNGNRVCTGSQMGRRNTLPDDPQTPCKLRLVRLRMVGGDYDQGGAYWGCGFGKTWIYRALGDAGEVRAEVFVRSESRENAKRSIRALLPLARFFN